MDKEEKCHLRHHPQARSGVPFVDIFACRCPQRPNRIAMSTVELVGRTGNVLKLKGLDILNNTPILDIKPYWPVYEAVKAFYTYLKARRMEDSFNLLSEEYLKKTNFEEWTNRFTDILDVDVIKSEKFENTKDIAFVKFSTKNWVAGEAEMHFYEGTWQTVKEGGVYKMLKSKILEVEKPRLGLVLRVKKILLHLNPHPSFPPCPAVLRQLNLFPISVTRSSYWFSTNLKHV